ncbi:PQQ-binding-like beta-propeller repeat protein [Pseudobacteriovorax antillogorgiicola]|uniref:Beta-barrel assembly machine subunit BamB n=1 Tax=Pseudobacteriovorax antillogorgiicola TaxID=1513793 RepID=A0A1Y6CB07_9BACT|nr:PQQ-binding-like beta-propeller repeat protein [Pseudobacteriovorax antillogorgiicola]TCS48670.1 Beta-barrel assembly machine subunit BamB [Pseudobacteriovorax antillogorgiicola]SMF55001.1 Beta-barrel assembly machine subunit BamB [Pseudobacteriovorax antillogorgiicola]
MKRFAGLFLLFSSCASIEPKNLCLSSDGGDTPCRPYRAGMISLNRDLDQQKPLGVAEEGGWVVVDDLLIGSAYSGWLQATSLKTKANAWWLELGNPVASPVASIGQHLVVGLRDGTVMKVDAKTGKVSWKQRLGRFVSRRPTLTGSSLLVTTVDQKLFALDFTTGQTRWIYNAGSSNNIILDGGAAPTVLGSLVLVGTSEGEVHGVDLNTGKRIWDFVPASSSSRFNDVVGQMASLDGNLLVSRYDGMVFSMSVATGRRRILWQKDLTGITDSYYRDGVYYIGCLNGDFYALDGISGRVLWKSEVGEPTASITPGEKIVYVGGTGGRISALDTKTGQLLWADDVEGALSRTPVLFGDILYFSTGLKVLYGYKVL